MSGYSEQALAARFAALESESVEGDWLDVQRRVRRTRKRRALVLVAAALLGCILVGSALAFGPRILDFFSAERAPTRVVLRFEQSKRERKRLWGESMPVIATEARSILSVDFPRGGRVLVAAAPRRGGGFCYETETAGGYEVPGGYEDGCVSPAIARMYPLESTGGGSEAGPTQDRGVRRLSGYVALPKTARLELQYENGSHDDVPFVWVTEPIDAGFFAYDPGPGHEQPGLRAEKLVALDGQGGTLASWAFGYFDPNDPWDVRHLHVGVWPKAIDPATARVLVFPGSRGNVHFASARNGPGFCWEPSFGGGGCNRPPTWSYGIFLSEGRPQGTYLLGTVADDVASVELRFEDGARAEIHPQERVVFYEIPRSRFPRGRRLVQATYRDAAGQRVGRTRFDPKQNAYYEG